MSNNIDLVSVSIRHLDPVRAEVWITVFPEVFDLTLNEVRGRLLGPRCIYASTVEVAYPIVNLTQQPDIPGGITARVIVPEPSFWDPVSPFLYQGTVELWEHGRIADAWPVSLGLRSLQLGPRGLRLNGQSVTLRGKTVRELTDEDALRLREKGYNTLFVDSEKSSKEICNVANRYGFLVLGRWTKGPDYLLPRLFDQFIDWMSRESEPPSCLGWILPPAILDDKEIRGDVIRRLRAKNILLGAEMQTSTHPEDLRNLGFVLCSEHLLSSMTEVHYPTIVLASENSREMAKEFSPSLRILGVIEP